MNVTLKTLIAGFLLLGSGLSHAAPSAQEQMQQVSDEVIAALKENSEAISEDPQLIFKLADEIVLPYFDFERMSRLVLGRHWRTASDEQKTQFTEEFRKFLVRTYGTAMHEYSGQEVEVLPSNATDDADDAMVRTRIKQPNGPDIPINYALTLQDDMWKVYNISVEGTSLVTTYRSSYASIIDREGLDSLIAKLAERNQLGKRGSSGSNNG